MTFPSPRFPTFALLLYSQAHWDLSDMHPELAFSPLPLPWPLQGPASTLAGPPSLVLPWHYCTTPRVPEAGTAKCVMEGVMKRDSARRKNEQFPCTKCKN